ncbi:hypothetical protein [Leeuwenhoekiella sp. MAR_2009_132]|uniref:hypothetical protein n=1 Tax=Leeuwenhoekiella sp. MAR_2009_132 TaxID=1392489 RepID=UPI00055BFD03|nr:hypothetical protein [Leeuwenhoekiella sp. MAR_2009_132]
METQQKTSIANYKRMGIEIEVLDSDRIKISQTKLINGLILNQQELVQRAREVFPGCKVVPVVFSLEVDSIDIFWIESRMKEFGIKRNDLIKQLALSKSYLSRIFNNGPHNVELSKPMKATFFYYFLTYEINRDFREHLNT